MPMFGSGTGTKGAGGPGILQTLGTVAVAMPLLPLVTGVFGALTDTVVMIPTLPRQENGRPQAAEGTCPYHRQGPARVASNARLNREVDEERPGRSSHVA